MQNSIQELIIQRGLLEDPCLVERLAAIAESCALICDERIGSCYGQALLMRLQQGGMKAHLFCIPEGEASKSRELKAHLEDCMIQAGLGRESFVIALGGGVVMDLAGFVAATYLRGIPLVLIPTTLLGQVDACIGGKVAINTPLGKNLIGAFYPAQLVVIDPMVLTTLSLEERRNGMAEVIKMGLIASPSLLEISNLEEIITTCCEIKMQIVQQDPLEKGLRRMLNFGHTAGHAIETALGYQISHGAAVALGMLIESYVSDLSTEDLRRVRALLDGHGFSLVLPKMLDVGLCIEFMQRDKKNRGGEIHCVLLKSIGEVHPFGGVYTRSVPVQRFQEAFTWLS